MKINKTLAILLIALGVFLLLGDYVLAQPTAIEVSGDIVENTIWEDDTVKVQSDITVLDDITLTINPGTYVEFQGYYNISVKGILIAEGVPGDTIRFAINDATGWDTFDDPGGGWGGILFADTTGNMADNDTSRLSICKFSHTKVHYNYSRSHGGTIFCYQFNKLVIRGCLFEEGYAASYGGAMYIHDSRIRLLDNSIIRYSAMRGAAIYIIGSLRIENNTISNNNATNGGGAIWLQTTDTIILRDNNISNNHSDYNGGAIYGKASFLILENNLVYGNSSDEKGGAFFCQGSLGNLIISNNQFYDNYAVDQGGAVYLYPYSIDSGLVENNHVYDNTSDEDGGGLYINSADDLLVRHNDIHGNTAELGGAIYSWGNLNLFDNEIYNNETGYDYGGAVVLIYGNQHIRGNEIYNNSAQMRGGAIHIESGSPRVEGNLIYNNYTDTRDGGAIYIRKATPEIIGNLITGNNAHQYGGGIFFEESDGLFINNIIVNNEAQEGGAVYLDKNSSPQFVNNTISKNNAVNSETGGAVFIGIQCVPAFYNNIINENISGGIANQIAFSSYNPFSDFYNCNIQGGEAGFTQVPGSSFMGDYLNNFDLDPLFILPSSVAGNPGDGLNADWSTEMNSPCINKGTLEINLVELPDDDYAGNRRISYGKIDVGAFEYADTVYGFCGTISSDAVWAADTIKVCNDVIIDNGATLTVLPGVYVEFQDQYELQVNGTLLSIGTINDPVIFSAKDTAGFADPDVNYAGWDGIRFTMNSSSDSSRLSHTIIEYCKIGDLFQGGAISALNSPKLSIYNCIIRHNNAMKGGAIYAYGSPILIRKSYFLDNSLKRKWDNGGAVYLEYSDALIDGCVFEENIGGFGAAIYLDECDPTISGCTFKNNLALNKGGGIFVGTRSNPLITHNIFQYNEAIGYGNGGAIALEGEHPVIRYNVLSNNSGEAGGAISVSYENNLLELSNNIIANNSATKQGGGIFSYGKSLELVNNTIVNNNSDDEGGGLYLRQYLEGTIRMYNSIFWGNTGQGAENQIHLNEFLDLEIHYSNIQGGIDSITGTAPVTYENNIDTEPGFVNPSSGTGAGYATQIEDWILASNSTSINNGIPDVTDLPIDETDILGNERIHFNRIDQGALENQGDIPVILIQPVTRIRCEGEDVSFTVRVNDSVDYQWTKDEDDIAGANAAVLAIDSLTVNEQGTYQCILRNSYGTIYTNPVFLQVKEKPEILKEPEITWAEIYSSAIIETFAQGTDLKYQWQKDNVDIPNQKTPKLTIDNVTLEDEGQYKCIISNSCLTIESEEVDLYLAPQICMVTVSSTTGHNLVVWEKKSIAPIIAYNIYRESVAAGLYDRLATISFDELSVFVDTTADPTVQAYLYKITAIDTAENETDIDLCKPHKTVHLIVSTNPELNTTQLQWDRYYGFDYQTYTIYRSTTGLNFDPIHSLSASNNSWTDPDPSDGDLFYRIAVEKPIPCEPEDDGKKAGTGPYRHSLSNMDNNKLKAGEQPPDTILLSNNTIKEEKLPGTMVGKLSTMDKDSLDSHTYKFVPGEGDTNNASFTLMGDLILASESFDYETKSQYHIRIRSTDEAGNYCEIPFIIQIVDVDETTGLPVLNSGKIRAYPNPFRQSTTISWANLTGESYRMVLTDLSGKVCRMVDEITTSEHVLQKAELKPGLYFIELRGPKIYRGKIMIE